MIEDKRLEDLVRQIDAVIFGNTDIANHAWAGILLSRVTLLMESDPATGKELLKFVWEKLDELEQSNPGQFL